MISESNVIRKGVPQGPVLGSLLYLLHISSVQKARKI